MRDGLIVINTHGTVADGTTVEVVRVATRTPRGSAAKASVAKPGRKSAGKKPPRAKSGAAATIPGYGGWAHRKDIKDTVEFAAQLRQRVADRFIDG